MDGHADVKKLMVTFHNFVNEPKKEHCTQSKTTVPSCLTTCSTVFFLLYVIRILIGFIYEDLIQQSYTST